MSAKDDQSLPKHIHSVIAESSQADYDGHTEFAHMTPSQRLAWLDQAVLFIHRNKLKGQAVTETSTDNKRSNASDYRKSSST